MLNKNSGNGGVELPFIGYLGSAAMAGGVAAAVTSPLDVVKTRLQVFFLLSFSLLLFDLSFSLLLVFSLFFSLSFSLFSFHLFFCVYFSRILFLFLFLVGKSLFTRWLQRNQRLLFADFERRRPQGSLFPPYSLSL